MFVHSSVLKVFPSTLISGGYFDASVRTQGIALLGATLAHANLNMWWRFAPFFSSMEKYGGPERKYASWKRIPEIMKRKKRLLMNHIESYCNQDSYCNHESYCNQDPYCNHE